MPIFVKAHRQAGHLVRGYTRGSRAGRYAGSRRQELGRAQNRADKVLERSAILNRGNISARSSRRVKSILGNARLDTSNRNRYKRVLTGKF